MGILRYHSTMDYLITQAIATYILLLLVGTGTRAQTEGDPGYEYEDAYDQFDPEDALGYEPSFDVPIVNVTVVEGQTAVLPCSINYLGKYKVAWMDQNRIPLTFEDRRVVDDTSFSIVRPYHKEWNLQITHVKYDYQGQYRCTINTIPEAKYKTVMLYVKVPAQIIDELSSDDVTVEEHDTVVLICNVTGIPHPTVTWYRKPTNSLASEKQKIGMAGEMIIIQNVSRYCDNIYECVAGNGVPPDISRQMRVTVEFPPEITLLNKRIGQVIGAKQTVMECIITAFPHYLNDWEKDDEKVTSDSKHTVDAYHEGTHTLILSLTIHDLEPSDFGKYTCVAGNSLGQDEESMVLYEYNPPSKHQTPSPTPVIVVDMTDYPKRHNPTRNPKDKEKGKGKENKTPYEKPQVSGSRDGSLPGKGAAFYTVTWTLVGMTSCLTAALTRLMV